MFVLLGLIWVDSAFESAVCWLTFSCPASWTAVPLPDPDWVWFVVCPVELWFPATEFADELLFCVTDPLLPGLNTRTEMFVLLGLICSDVALEVAVCPFTASCPDVCWAYGVLATAGPAPSPRSRPLAISARKRVFIPFSSCLVRRDGARREPLGTGGS